MTFLVHTPSAPLRPFVSAFYCPRGTMPYPHELVFPVATTDLKINFGDAILAYRSGATEPFVVCKDSWCTGPSDRHHEIRWAQQGDFIGISFTLAGASALLGNCISELRDHVVPLEALWGRAAAEMRERLYEAKGAAARFALLDQLLLQRIQSAAPGVRLVRQVLEQISHAELPPSVRQLTEQAKVSQKHLIEMFNRHVGLTPKQVLRLDRFRRILADIDPTNPLSWTKCAYRYGYADQSHFSKDFVSFTGTTPTEYLALRRRVMAEQPAHAASLRLLSLGSQWNSGTVAPESEFRRVPSLR